MHNGRIAERRLMVPPRAGMEAMVQSLQEQSQEDQIHANSVREAVNGTLNSLERLIDEQARMRRHAAEFGDDVRREQRQASEEAKQHADASVQQGMAEARAYIDARVGQMVDERLEFFGLNGVALENVHTRINQNHVELVMRMDSLAQYLDALQDEVRTELPSPTGAPQAKAPLRGR